MSATCWRARHLSLTFFFHLIPGVTETLTQLPSGAPLFTSPEDPALQKAVGTLFIQFLVGTALQIRHLWALRPAAGRAGMVV